jgi:hypothetical protein
MEDSKQLNKDIVSCIALLHLFCTGEPSLLVPHINVLQPYLSTNVCIQNFNEISPNIDSTL